MSASDHYTDPRGGNINLAFAQDAAGPNCSTCGRTVFPRNGGNVAEPWQHAIECPKYQPHPDSIAGQPGYVPTA